jgi:hypothetical protein
MVDSGDTARTADRRQPASLLDGSQQRLVVHPLDVTPGPDSRTDDDRGYGVTPAAGIFVEGHYQPAVGAFRPLRVALEVFFSLVGLRVEAVRLLRRNCG